MDQCHGAACIYKALNLAGETFRDHARRKNLGIPRVTVLMGSGTDDDKVGGVKAAKDLKAQGVTLFTIAVRGGYMVPDYALYRDLGTLSLKSLTGCCLLSDQKKTATQKFFAFCFLFSVGFS